jgi:2,5-dihydroxypyridine 5,6-dioxygenase
MDPKSIEMLKCLKAPARANVKPGEKALILADFDTPPTIWESLAAAIYDVGGEPIVTVFPTREFPMQDPPKPVAEAMKAADLCFLTVSKGMIHCGAAHEAMKANTRFVNLEEATPELVCMTHETFEDIQAMQALGQRMADLWTAGKTCRVTTPLGMDMTANIEGRTGYFVAGISRKQPALSLISCAFPDGEAGVAPVEVSGQGVMVYDLAMLAADIGRLNEAIRLTIKDGRVTKIEGGFEANALRAFLEKYGDEGAYQLCEISIGLNPKIKPTGNKADKKIYGTMHTGLGANKDIGGTIESRLHMDGVISRPTLYIDGKMVIQDGKINV